MIFSSVTSHQRQNPFPSLSEGSNTRGLSAQELRVHAFPINHKVSRCSRTLQVLSPSAWKQNRSSEIRVCLVGCWLCDFSSHAGSGRIIPSPRWTEALPCISISSWWLNPALWAGNIWNPTPSQENLFHSEYILNTEKEDQATAPRFLRERKAGNPQARVPELTHFGRVRLIAVYDQNILGWVPGGCFFFSWGDRHWETEHFFSFLLAAPPGMWHLSSLTRDWTRVPWSGSAVLTTGPPGKPPPPHTPEHSFSFTFYSAADSRSSFSHGTNDNNICPIKKIVFFLIYHEIYFDILPDIFWYLTRDIFKCFPVTVKVNLQNKHIPYSSRSLK